LARRKANLKYTYAMNDILRNLNFGAPAAERDISHGLKDYFVESEAYRRVRSGQKTIVLGNRGSGKSAIFKIIAERERSTGSLVIELSPEDYSYGMLSKAMVSEDRGRWVKQGAYSSAWKYLIYLLVMKELANAGPKLKTGTAAHIYEYLRDHHEDQAQNPVALLISYLKRIEGVKIGNYEAAIKTRELTKLYKLEEIQRLLPAVKELCAKRRVIVLIDELDSGWDASEDAKAFVAGLFQASVSINELTPKLRVYVSLRRELYDSIPALYDDAQKYRDIIENIRWSEPSLLALIAKRIKYNIPDFENINDAACWDYVFVPTVGADKCPSFTYLIGRTLYRPREILEVCTEALTNAQDANRFPIDEVAIGNAEMVYSEARTKDIAAEYRFQYPGLLSLFELFRGRSHAFSRDELELLSLSISTGEFRLDAGVQWVREQEPEFIIDVLWRIGFLRGWSVGGVAAPQRRVGSFLGPHQVPTLNLSSIQRFHVHPMFRAYLGLEDLRAELPVEQM
jgi:Fe-S cluster assembly ATPase SufC